MAKVTIVIPCYNAGRFILRAIDSIKIQTFQDVKIIVVDDGSTNDDTKNTLSQIVGEDITIYQIENQGPSFARNYGIQKANSKYIVNLDADDWFEETFIEKAVKILDTKPEIGIVTCHIQCFGDNNEIWKINGGGIKECLVKVNCAASSAFRKECWEEVNGYDEDRNVGFEDWDFWLRIQAKNWRVFVIDETLFHYRVQKISRSSRSEKEKTAILRRHYEKFEDIYSQHIIDVLTGLHEEKILSLRKSSFFNILKAKLRYYLYNLKKIIGVVRI